MHDEEINKRRLGRSRSPFLISIIHIVAAVVDITVFIAASVAVAAVVAVVVVAVVLVVALEVESSIRYSAALSREHLHKAIIDV